MKKIILLICFVLGNSLLESCGPDDAFCYDLEISDVPNFSLESYNEVGAGETIAANNYAILLNATGSGEYCFKRNLAGGSLLADIFYEPNDDVENISITSDADLNAAYPAGSELKELFVPLQVSRACIDNQGADCVYNYYSETSLNSLEEVFNRIMSADIFLNFESESPSDLHMFSLQTDEVITVNEHVFTIRFDYQSGRSDVLETDRITVN